ncbi:MAG: DUF2628 domain-containing protein [Oscillospiraceae bacterium]|jgi:predicted RNA-binding Zn-ribbon protein involved in translation (DUF1610 family)|nr:DUF2628 domain-containing protein [Oscillospiraceae bacterium]
MRYEKIPCPGCGVLLTAGDDVVVCPDCGAPQHRACWQSEGRCALQARHGADFSWQVPEGVAAPLSSHDPETILEAHLHRWQQTDEEDTSAPVPSTEEPAHIFCPNCGRRAQSGENMQCDNCGYLFFVPSATRPGVPGTPRIWLPEAGDPSFMPANADVGGHTAADLALAVQHNTRVYLPRFKQMVEGTHKPQLHVAAFFLRGYWFFYRKMYKLGALFLAAQVVLTALQSYLLTFTDKDEIFMAALGMAATPDTSVMEATSEAMTQAALAALPWYLPSLVGTLILCLVAGFIANGQYFRHAGALIDRLRAVHKDEVAFQFAAVREGGTSMMAASSVFLLLFLVQEYIIPWFL